MSRAVLTITGMVCLAAGTVRRPARLAWVEAPVYLAEAWMAGAERFPAGAVIQVSDENGRRTLAPNFAASTDPAVSFDGRRILFSGRQKAAEPWRVFEIDSDGVAARQVTTGDGDCIRPLYLPQERIVYTRVAKGTSWIEVASLAGGTPERLSFSNAPVLTADVLRDGRILFETRFGGHDFWSREIMTIYPDGTGVEAVRCDHGPDRYSARQVANGDIVFVENGRLARFTSALATETQVGQPVGRFAGGVADTGSGEWILALRENSRAPFFLGIWNLTTHSLRRVSSPGSTNALQPVVVAPHEAPKRFPSALVASRTAVNLLCLDAHTTRDSKIGSIRSVRVFTQTGGGREQLLGETAIEKDGSFFVQTPADQPIRMELLDATGQTVRSETNWWWGRAAEQRVCVGCHAGPERAPRNAVPEVLLRNDVPVRLTPANGGR